MTSASMRQFAGIDLGREPVPDETTVCKFRHLLEQHDLGRPDVRAGAMRICRHAASRLSTGTIVDATIISAPSSTKNAAQAARSGDAPDPKGKQWYFGMKAHVGVDSKTKLIHAVVATAANVHDATVLPRPAAWRGDAGLG